jgi:hypothetical protein
VAETPITPVDLESPQAALDRSEKLEAAILDAAFGALGVFLDRMVTATLGGDLTRGSVVGYWKAAMESALSHPAFAAIRDDLLAELNESELVDDAYDAGIMAISTARNMSATPDERAELVGAVFAHTAKPTGGLLASLSDKVDGWLRRRISKSIGRNLAKPGGSLEDPNLIRNAETVTEPHPSATLVTPADWQNDDRPGDINWQDRMQRDIRTAYTRIFGRQMQRQLEKAGYLKKMWVTRHDERVRPTHVAADHQIVDVHSRFHVGADALRYPGDPMGTPGETINCRCVQVGVPD